MGKTADQVEAQPVTDEPGAGAASCSPQELLTLARRHAAELGADHLEEAASLTSRRYLRLFSNDRYEVWVIDWPEGGALELHDHGGSSGAFQVVRGILEEHFAADPQEPLRSRQLPSGCSSGFGPSYVHDVRNRTHLVATSVHAYSPPLTSMRFFARAGSLLEEVRSESGWDGHP